MNVRQRLSSVVLATVVCCSVSDAQVPPPPVAQLGAKAAQGKVDPAAAKSPPAAQPTPQIHGIPPDQLTALQFKLKEKDDKISEVSKQRDEERQRVQALKEEIDKMKAAQEALKTEKKAAQEEQKKLQAELDALNARKNELNTSKVAYQADYDRMSRENADLLAQTKALADQQKELSSEKKDLEHKVAELAAQRDRAQSDLHGVQLEVEELGAKTKWFSIGTLGFLASTLLGAYKFIQSERTSALERLRATAEIDKLRAEIIHMQRGA